MKNHLTRALRFATIAAALIAESHAGSPLPVTVKCPVGGKKFTYITTGAYSEYGSRPDGKPYGTWRFPLELPQCPDNGLVMYRKFTRPEVKALKGLLASPEYQQMRKADTPYYLAYWLMGRLGDATDSRLWVLQQASWETDFDLARKRRYQQEYVQLAQGQARPEPPKNDRTWFSLQVYAANALRELGQFDAALQLLDSLPLNLLDVRVPAEKVSFTADGTKNIDNYGDILDAGQRQGMLGFVKQLRRIVERHDASSEPIEMLPRRISKPSVTPAPSPEPVQAPAQPEPASPR